MSGFPTRLLRRVFGPRFKNARPIENPETECGEETLNPLLWQVAGLNLVAARVSLVASYDGSSFTISHRAEAWNADEAQVHPVLARTAAGSYTYTFASSYLDEEGTAVQTHLAGARVTSLKPLAAFADRIVAEAWVDASNPLVVQVRLWNASGTLVDAPFWLEVL